ncbi:MAG: J domain-containing protein [Deltaproteobacteria bacterium]
MNYYDLLEVSPKASREVIEKAYRVLVKRHHPDFHKKEDKAREEEILKNINNAYEILSNDEKRQSYDIEIGISVPVQQELSQANNETEDLIVKAFVNWFRGGAK